MRDNYVVKSLIWTCWNRFSKDNSSVNLTVSDVDIKIAHVCMLSESNGYYLKNYITHVGKIKYA